MLVNGEMVQGSVRLEDVTKAFKEVVAVDGISLTVEEGEFFSLLGPSGCGKTTTLRMIGGFETPTSGAIFLGGRDVSNLPPYKRDVNTVFQSYALFPHFDVAENIAYGLKRKKVAGTEIDKRVKEMLELVDLPGYGSRKITQLSGGQQQRVALARALVNKPQVLLLDEPLGALDLKLRKQMQLELKRIQAEVGITFIYVTHDQDEAMTMSDRIAVMNAGRFEQVGPPHEMYEAPATGFVAGFLGASNLLDGEVVSEGKVRLDAGTTVAVPASRLGASSGLVKVGVRPEKLHISDTDRSGNSVEARIVASTYTGVSTTYSCVTSDGASMLVYVQNLHATPEVFAEGANVKLTWDPQHTFVIEKAADAGVTVTTGEGTT
jgi:spermidine/putrescine transport system ATP-binding protein